MERGQAALGHYTGHAAALYEPHSAELARLRAAGVGGVAWVGRWVIVERIIGLRVEYREMWV